MAPLSLTHLLSLPFAPAGIRIEQYADGNTAVVRAELPDRDPAKEIQVAIVDGELRIRAERSRPTARWTRSDFQYAPAYCAVPLAPGAMPDAATARYHNGILEFRIPVVPHATAPRSGAGFQEIQVGREPNGLASTEVWSASPGGLTPAHCQRSSAANTSVRLTNRLA